MMESIWIMPRSTARSMDSAGRQKDPRRPNRSARNARTSGSDFVGGDFGAAFCKVSVLPADPGFGEARHAAVAAGGGAEDRNGKGGTRGFTQPHAEIQQRHSVDGSEQPA